MPLYTITLKLKHFVIERRSILLYFNCKLTTRKEIEKLKILKGCGSKNQVSYLLSNEFIYIKVDVQNNILHTLREAS